MASKLNPDAQEFVPSSPVNSHGGLKENSNHHLNMLGKDEILAQSPRKAAAEGSLFDLPDAEQFNAEISKCPHEFDGVYLPQSPTNYQEINLKEAMHGDEKKDEGVEDTSEKSPQTVDDQLNDLIKNIPGTLTLGETVPGENDPMNMSYHQDINDGSFSKDPHDMNSVHLLPSKEELEESGEEDTKENGDVRDEDLKPEEDMFQGEPEQHYEMESEKPESELEAATVLLDFAQQKPNLVDFDPVPQQLQQQQGIVNVTDLDSDFTGIAEQAKHPANIADAFVSNIRVDEQGMDLNLLPESESKSHMEESNNVEDSPESDHCFLKESATDLMATQETVVPSKVETPPPTPAVTNNGIIELSHAMRLTSPEPHKLMEAVEKLAEPAEAKTEEKLVDEMSKTEEKKDDESALPIEAALGVASAGVAVAVAATLASKAAAKEDDVKKKATKTVAESLKKDEPKAKPRTTKPPTGTVKASQPATAAKSPAGKVSPIKPPSTLSTRPKSSPAATARPPVSATAKSPLSTARKPLTSPSTATKSPLTGTTKATAAPRVAATKSPLTRPTSATTTKTSSIGAATKTTTSTTAAGNVKKTTSTVTATKNLSTKPTVLSAKPKVPAAGGTSVTSSTTTVTKTTRTALSSAKPRVPSATTTTTTTRTLGAAKDKDAAATKTSTTTTRTTSRPMSASTKPLVPKPTITSTLRKAAETTSKVTTTNSARNGVKTSTTTTSTVGKRPASLTSRTTTTTTTTKKATSKVGEKKPVATVTEIKKTIEVTEKLSNGDVLHTDGNVDGIEAKKEVESQKILDNAAQLIIDLKND